MDKKKITLDILKYINIGNHIWELWLKIDLWWSAKKPLEKANLRKNFLIAGLISLMTYNIVRNRIDSEKTTHKHLLEKNVLINENNRLKELDNERIRGENKEMKERNKIVDSLTIELEVIKRTTK